MQTLPWQFWTDFSVKALGVLVTSLAVIVALFGAWLRYRLAPPQLGIGLSSAEGMAGTIYARVLSGTTFRWRMRPAGAR